MPEIDFRLASFPTEVHVFAIDTSKEIHEARLDILHDAAQLSDELDVFLNGQEQKFHLRANAR